MEFKDIISIHGAPRSGTSWLGQIFDSSPEVRYKFQPLFSYAFKDRLNLQSSAKEIDEFFNEVYLKKDPFLDQEDKKEKGSYPVFEEKDEKPNFLITKMVRYHFLIPHFLSNMPSIKVIGIVRHPCGVLNSWYKAPREFRPEWDFKKEWQYAPSKNQFRPEEYFGYNRWKELTQIFLYCQEKWPEKFYLIRYEDLVENTIQVIGEAFLFSGIEMNKQTKEFLLKSKSDHQNDEYSVYKGNKDHRDWESELDKNIIKHIYKDLAGTNMEIFLK
ncbi:sulfotransferase [Domibacillus sp.]|uniref:sulfotransferase family protein n=1 Tax=Domibacillus sp. TaxID=1969783 RepID=UPI002811C16F|nr:sulfotransferase [Domibacillus sp.]